MQFGKATLVDEGNQFTGRAIHLNGNPENWKDIKISKRATLADDAPLSEGMEVLVMLSKNGKVSEKHIYPFPSNQPPQFITGGIGKAIVTDGNQDPYGGGSRLMMPGADGELEEVSVVKYPQRMVLSVKWINGVEVFELIENFELGSKAVIPVNQAVYFLCNRNADGRLVATELVVAEGDAL